MYSVSLTRSYKSLKILLSQKLDLFLGAILREGEKVCDLSKQLSLFSKWYANHE